MREPWWPGPDPTVETSRAAWTLVGGLALAALTLLCALCAFAPLV